MIGKPIKRAREKALYAARGQLPPLKPPKNSGPKKFSPARPSIEWEDPAPAGGRGAAPDEALSTAIASLLDAPSVAKDGVSDDLLAQQLQFDELVKLALKDALYIARLEPDPSDPNFVKILTRKQAVIASVMSAVVRIDEARYRAARQGKVEQVLKAMKELQAKTIN